MPVQAHTAAELDYSHTASHEMHDSAARPAIAADISNMAEYEVVFVGYPIWWEEAPRIIHIFLESYDFTGKTIVPFCTSSSSGIGNSAVSL